MEKIIEKRKIQAKNIITNQINLANKHEIKFMDILKNLKYKYIWQKSFYDYNHVYVADFYVKKLKMVIEIDGSYHKKNRDRRRDEYLIKNFGIRYIVRIKVGRLKDMKSLEDEFTKRINDLLKRGVKKVLVRIK